MKEDIQVQEIINAFKGKAREEIFSSAVKDEFLTLMQSKKRWTKKEYKEFYYNYCTEYLHMRMMDSVEIFRIKKENNFLLDWEDYFHIIDNLKSEEEKKQYINRYFWYHSKHMDEKQYNILEQKPYFKYLDKESRCRFLQHTIKIQNFNNYSWIKKYFTKDEISEGIKLTNFNIDVYTDRIVDEVKEQKVKDFYNKYESYFGKNEKAKFFDEVIRTGSFNLIDFCYKEKKIRGLEKIKILWTVCSDIFHSDTLKTLNHLKDIGIKFNIKDLYNAQKHNQWGYMERTEELIYFFKDLELKKLDNKLTKKTKEDLPKTKL